MVRRSGPARKPSFAPLHGLPAGAGIGRCALIPETAAKDAVERLGGRPPIPARRSAVPASRDRVGGAEEDA